MNTIKATEGSPAAERRLFLRMAGAGMGAVTLGIVGCGGGGDSELVPRIGSTVCASAVWKLVTLHGRIVGNVTVANTATDLIVTYTLTEAGATFGNLRLWAGTDFSTLDKGGASSPAPDQLPHHQDATGLTTATITIPLVSLGFTTCQAVLLYAVTYAEVKFADGSGDGAFGGTTWGAGSDWWMWGSYTLCCETVPPPVEYRTETAYAKGTNTFIGLHIGRNWGWAIELKSVGRTTCDILAGAGGNVGGTKVGTLTIDWNGSQATVTWSLTDGALMSEAHLYAGDKPPTTAAPGQYGHTMSFDPWSSAHSVTVPLVDSGDSDGVWLIAHAVVNIPL